MRPRNKSQKEESQVKIKNQSTFFKPNKFKIPKKNIKIYQNNHNKNLIKTHYETNGTGLWLDEAIEAD